MYHELPETNSDIQEYWEKIESSINVKNKDFTQEEQFAKYFITYAIKNENTYLDKKCDKQKINK